jgi:tRNA-specific 2-thiouridylase
MSGGRGILLFSGGLDSLLAARLLMDQGIEVIGLHCVLPFVPPDADPEMLMPARIAAGIKVNLRYHRCGKEYIGMIRNPSRGYGKRANPCIDCHIYFITKAAELMRELNADFVATGEVVGQRPMSQMKHTMNHIEKAAGVKGRLLRPLSAKLLKPTFAEEENVVNRDLLLGLNGRSRKAQLEMARRYGISEYSSPSGGCLFTDASIAGRVFDLIGRHQDVDALDFYLLTIGRHFRLSDAAKLIVARNEFEDRELQKYLSQADYFFLPGFKGPSIYVKGVLDDRGVEIAASVIRRYGKARSDTEPISMFQKGEFVRSPGRSVQITDGGLESIRIR